MDRFEPLKLLYLSSICIVYPHCENHCSNGGHLRQAICDDDESAERQTQTKAAHQEIPKRHSVSNCGIGDNEANTFNTHTERDRSERRENL